MDTFENLKTRWQQQPVENKPNDVFREILKNQRRMTRPLIWAVISLSITGVLLTILGMLITFESFISLLGLILIVTIVLIFAGIQLVEYLMMRKDYSALPVSEYLREMIHYQKRQNLMYTLGLNSYYVLLSIGLGLYLWEFTQRLEPGIKLTVYGLTFGWIAFTYLYMRPKIQKKHRAKTQALIDQLKELAE